MGSLARRFKGAPKGGGMSVVETVHLGVRVPEDVIRALNELAKSRERSVSAEVRLALRQYLENEQKEAA